MSGPWMIVTTSVAWLLAGMILVQVWQGYSVMVIVTRASFMMAGLGGLAWLLALVFGKYLKPVEVEVEAKSQPNEAAPALANQKRAIAN